MTPPVVSSVEVEIDAPIEVVWSTVVAIEDWPEWNPDVKSALVDGPVTEGTAFRWKAGPGTIRSTTVRLEPPRLVAWTGRTLGIRAQHVWRLEHREGRTIARTEEAYDGFVARVLRRLLQGVLDKALTGGARHLELEAERRAREQAAAS